MEIIVPRSTVTLKKPIPSEKIGILYEYLMAQSVPFESLSCLFEDGTVIEIQYFVGTTPEDIERGDALAAAFELPPEPKWGEFRDAISEAEAWLSLAQSNVGRAVSLSHNLKDLKDDPTRFPAIAKTWNQMVAISGLTKSQVEDLKAIAASTNMPFHFADDGSVSP